MAREDEGESMCAWRDMGGNRVGRREKEHVHVECIARWLDVTREVGDEEEWALLALRSVRVC